MAEIITYIEGEDAKRIDWKSTAKTGIPHIKLFYEEKEAHIALALCMSSTLLFKDKREKALEIATRLGYETLHLSHTLTPIMIAPKKVTILPTSKKFYAVDTFIKKADALTLLHTTLSMENAITEISRHLKKRSLLIMIGDFLEEIDLTPLTKRHTLFLIIVRDHFEENPTPLGEGSFSDLESGESRSFYFGKKAAQAYKEAYRAHDKKLFSHLRRLGIPYKKIIGDGPIF